MTVTFASLLTPEGIVVAAALVTTLVEFIKRLTGTDFAGAWIAFALSAALYVLAAIATNVAASPTPLDAGLAVFLAWLACATSSVGIHSTVRFATSTPRALG
mgnify:CR=1 FL=1